MKLIATKALQYGTRHLVAGESFETKKKIEGLLLISGRKAKKAPVPARPRKVPAEPAVETEAVGDQKTEEAEAVKTETEKPPGTNEQVIGRPVPRTVRPQGRT